MLRGWSGYERWKRKNLLAVKQYGEGPVHSVVGGLLSVFVGGGEGLMQNPLPPLMQPF